jgi:hypothetical protein
MGKLSKQINFSFCQQVLILFAPIAFSIILSGCTKEEKPPATKAAWIQSYFRELESGKYPDIKATSWWNENFDNTFLKINSSPFSLSSFRSLAANVVFYPSCNFSNHKLMPLQDKIYYSAFPDFGGTEDSVSANAINDFENQSGKKIAWAYFSNNWLDSLVFPAGAVSLIRNHGSTPYIRLMYRSNFDEGKADPELTMANLASGRYDSSLTRWMLEAKNCGTDLLVEFGTEVNGSWFPWNGIYSGAGIATGYGDPQYPDGPEVFRDAYRHIIDLYRQLRVQNITWFYHFDVNDEPEEWWNNPVYYYPGDSYIDWIGVSTYGQFSKDEDYIDPALMLEKAYSKLKAISSQKPYAILEFGVTEL